MSDFAMEYVVCQASNNSKELVLKLYFYFDIIQ